MNKKLELLAPAGDLEKLKIAVLYGADAVYLGGEHFGLRAKAKNFTPEQMKEGVEFAHKHNVKVYVTCNIFAHNDDFNGLEDYLKFLYDINVDAVLVADPGIFAEARRIVPNMDIHISTQANNTNYHTALFWHKLGAKRIVMARELSLKEIKAISDNIPSELEIEAFVHGAMCISYSGRCLLSSFFTGRDANRGACAHPCRWKYYIAEETRKGEYMPIEEDERGTYIFNSKDLCMIEHIPELAEAGIYSLKIEGRIKTAYYCAAVIKIYREAIDDYMKDISIYESKKQYYLSEIMKASYRGFTTGFYYGRPNSGDQVYTSNSYIREYDFIGIVLEYDEKTSTAKIEQRNKFSVGEEIEFMRHNGSNFTQKVSCLTDENGINVQSAPHPQQILYIKTDKPVRSMDIMRKPSDNPITQI